MQTHQEVWMVQTTFAHQQVAKEIVWQLVSAQLAACATVLSQATSIYLWEGKCCEETECVVVFKTTKELVDELEAQIKKLHPYQTPMVLSWPIKRSLEDYSRYVYEVCKK